MLILLETFVRVSNLCDDVCIIHFCAQCLCRQSHILYSIL